jgi:hypothetical protein
VIWIDPPDCAASSRARATNVVSGSNPAGEATATCIPAAVPLSIKEWQTLLPSPMYASFKPLRPPNWSCSVKRSLSASMGWNRSVSALNTGADAPPMKVMRSSWALKRAAMPST